MNNVLPLRKKDFSFEDEIREIAASPRLPVETIATFHSARD